MAPDYLIPPQNSEFQYWIKITFSFLAWSLLACSFFWSLFVFLLIEARIPVFFDIFCYFRLLPRLLRYMYVFDIGRERRSLSSRGLEEGYYVRPHLSEDKKCLVDAFELIFNVWLTPGPYRNYGFIRSTRTDPPQHLRVVNIVVTSNNK